MSSNPIKDNMKGLDGGINVGSDFFSSEQLKPLKLRQNTLVVLVGKVWSLITTGWLLLRFNLLIQLFVKSILPITF